MPEPREDLVPAVGSVSQTERLFRVNWLDRVERSWGGAPILYVSFVAREAARVHLVDVRAAEELRGPLGWIPGSDWLPGDEVLTLAERLDRDDPVVLVSHQGERARAYAKTLEEKGMRFVAALDGGIVGWRRAGFGTRSDRSIEARRGLVARKQPAPAGAKEALDAEQIRAHVGDESSVRWIKFAALLLDGRVSCVDGRDPGGVVGTPGGDMGELLLGLGALEQVLGRPLSDAEIDEAFRRRLAVFGRFYFHSDIHAVNEQIRSFRSDARLDEALSRVSTTFEWRRFMSAPPPALRPILLEHMLRPQHLGCGHVRLALTRGERYGVRPELVLALVRRFWETRWSGDLEADFVILGEGHREGAVVDVSIDGALEPYRMLPLVSPSCNGTQMFVQHGQVSAYLRGQLASFLTDRCGLGERGRLEDAMRELGARQLDATLRELAAGLPVFQLLFTGETPSVRAVGHVPAKEAP